MLYLASAVLIGVLLLMAISIILPSWQPVLVAVLLSYSFLVSLRFTVYSLGALIFFFKERRRDLIQPTSLTPSVSVILPAYNEAKVIGEVLNSFRFIEYPCLEIIVVDDGSQDETYQQALQTSQKLDLNIKVFRKENGGKAKALNYGIAKASSEFVLCMDADSILTRMSIHQGVRHFNHRPKLAAVAGVVRALNCRKNLLTRFQQMDYYIGHFQRKILSLFSKVSIVPGPVGMFRKSALKNVGWYESDNGTFAEDTELTFRLIAAGWEVICDDDMVAWTEVPEDYESLLRQRYRWSRGVYQALMKNLDNFTFSATLSNSIFVIYLVWEQVLIPILDFAFLFSFVCIFILGESLSYYTPMFLLVLGADVCLSLFSCLRDERSVFYWLPVAMASRLTYVNVLLVWKIFAFYDEWKSVGMSWDKLTRIGFSPSSPTEENVS